VGQRVAGADAGRPNDRAHSPLAVTEVDRMLVDTHDRSTELDFDAARFELSLRVVAGALGKGRQETRCMSTNTTRIRSGRDEAVALNGDLNQLGQRARGLDAGRSSPDTTKVSCANAPSISPRTSVSSRIKSSRFRSRRASDRV